MGREETLTQRPGCQRPPGPPQLHLAGWSGTGRMRQHTSAAAGGPALGDRIALFL